MARRPVRVREWFQCPTCEAQVPKGYSSCTQCGHGRASWSLINAVLKLPGTREVRYTEDMQTTEGKPR